MLAGALVLVCTRFAAVVVILPVHVHVRARVRADARAHWRVFS